MLVVVRPDHFSTTSLTSCCSTYQDIEINQISGQMAYVSMRLLAVVTMCGEDYGLTHVLLSCRARRSSTS